LAKIKVIHDQVGETLTVYFDEPRRDQICEEAGEGVILMKDPNTGNVIGFEKLYFKPQDMGSLILEGQSIKSD
jgi:hypothetical protein